MSANSALLLTDSAARDGNAIALRLDGEEVTYRTLDRVSAEVAGLLRSRGVQPGDRIGLMLPNVTHFVAIYFGILRTGAVVVPMDPLLAERAVQHCLRDSSAREMFVWHDVASAAPAAMSVSPRSFGALLAAAEPTFDVVERVGDDTAVLYTCWTTGTPDGDERTHDDLRRHAEQNRDAIGIATGVRVLGCLPLFDTFGQARALNATIAARGTLTLLTRFDADAALDVIEAEAIEVFLGVPSMYARLVQSPTAPARDLLALHTCVSDGAALPVELRQAFETMFGCTVLEGSGLAMTDVDDEDGTALTRCGR